MYGYERMKYVLQAARQLPTKQMAEALQADVNAFCGTHPQDDDRTIVIIKFTKPNETIKMPNEKVTVNANYKDIRIPSEKLRAMLKRANVSEDITGLCELALHELLTNLVDHAYEGVSNGLIEVQLSCTSDSIIMQTQDSGTPANVNLDRVHMPDPADLAEGGYGMAIIRSLMDDVKYRTSQGKNIWQLIKHLK